MAQGFNSMVDAGSYLEHYGIKGQKWGERRFQNEDGSWTAAGRERYGSASGDKKQLRKEIQPAMDKAIDRAKKVFTDEDLETLTYEQALDKAWKSAYGKLSADEKAKFAEGKFDDVLDAAVEHEVSKYFVRPDRLTQSGSPDSSKSLSSRVGEKRLQNRVDKYANMVDDSAITINDNRRFQSTNIQAAKKLTEDQLADPSRTEDIGHRTIVQRTIASVAGVTGSAAAVVVTMGLAESAALAVPMAAIPAATAAWYLYKTKD